MKDIKKQVLQTAIKAGRRGISYKKLLIKSRLTAREQEKFGGILQDLKRSGELVEKKGLFYSAKRRGMHTAVISRVNQTFGFAKRQDNDEEIFIPGKFLKGALPGDVVQLRYIPARQEGAQEGEVVTVLEPGSGEFSGVLAEEHGRLVVVPDKLMRTPIPVMKGKGLVYRLGDKVTARIALRGQRHSEHRCRIIEGYGSSQKAASCAQAMLAVNGVSTEFSEAALEQAKRVSEAGIRPGELKNRLDLRSETIFTIDSADTKDIDDAVSLVKLGDCYQLGVHIADVSRYVADKSALDNEAYERGTSVYYADRVIPMLPKELSNGICSLNPGEDRLAFSALLTVSEKGELLDFDFKKTVICSRIKGVYSEINEILAHTAAPALLEKYAGLTDTLFLMEQLADILTANKKKRGAPEVETNESKIIVGEDGRVSDVRLRERGKSERIIEEFMLLANQAAASLGRRLELPFVYRVHEAPPEKKIESLKEILDSLGIPARGLKGEVTPGQLAAILAQAKGSKNDRLVNTYVLRSMAKAKYSEQPLGHFGLVLQDYAHFTSPIRRYPDLAIHRILSGIVNGEPVSSIQKRYRKFASAAALQATKTELRAMQTERDCEDCYKAEYMAGHLGEVYEGTVSSVAGHGVYVELANTVEGMVRTESLGEGFVFDGLMEMKNPSGKSYRVGDRIAVKCIRADVNSGQIDFEPA